MKYVVVEAMPLLNALQLIAVNSSKTTLRSWVKEGRVFIDGLRATRADELLSKGQTVTVGASVKRLPKGVKIIYQDPHLIAIDKPSGLLSVSTAFEVEETVHAVLKAYFKPNKVEVVHRLDQDTSGVMLFACTEKAKDFLKEVFEKHTLERLYVALVEGVEYAPDRPGVFRLAQRPQRL